jgi:hypothetical protein
MEVSEPGRVAADGSEGEKDDGNPSAHGQTLAPPR